MLLTIAAFFFVLSIVVFAHELGHFAVAKLNRIYVITFSFGFGPKLLKKRVGETEYALSALPFGGYVKFAGEPGEEEGTEHELPDGTVIPADRTYRNSHPLARIAVVVAGPAMNLILALLVYIGSLYIQGVFVNPSTDISAVVPGSAAEEAGMRVGDRIVGIEGERISYWAQIEKIVAQRKGAPTRYMIVRGKDTLSIVATPRFDDTTKSWRIGVASYLPPRVGDVKKDGPAARAGIVSGARILSINDTAITTYAELEEKIRPNAGIPLRVVWEIGGEVRTATITPASAEAAAEGEKLDVVKEGQIGVGPYYERVRISLGESIVYGWRAFTNLFRSIIDFLGKLFTGNATIRAVGGPIRVAMMAGDMIRWGFSYLIYFLAFFSLNLAIFNMLPILPFDGGHAVLSLIELVSRRRIGQKAQQVLAQVGFVILILLIVLVVALDIFNSLP